MNRQAAGPFRLMELRPRIRLSLSKSKAEMPRLYPRATDLAPSIGAAGFWFDNPPY